MGRIRPVALFVFALMLLAVPGAVAQEQETEGSLLLIMDASGSMKERSPAGGTRLDEAKRALRTVVSELPEDSQVGFRVYGHRVSQSDKARSCRDTELVVPVGPLDRGAMTAAINRYDAKGYTPIGYSLREGAKDLPPEGKRTIVLVSDGEDTCGNPPPCEAARELDSQGVDLTVETVGFRTNRKARAQLRCIAEETGGTYRDADNARELADSLVQLSTRATRTADIEGEQVTGAGAADDAPVLEPGTYQDNILPGESLWYAVELQEGQELRARATIGGFPDLDETLGAYLVMTMYNPLNEEILDPGFQDQCCAGPAAVTVANTTGTVDPDEIYAYEPGNYYVQVTLDDRANELNQPREFPLELEFEVTGQAPEETTIQSAPPEETSLEETTQQTPPEDTSTGQASSDGNAGDKEPRTIENEQASDSTNTLLLVVIVSLVALVAALGGALVAVLFMRRG